MIELIDTRWPMVDEDPQPQVARIGKQAPQVESGPAINAHKPPMVRRAMAIGELPLASFVLVVLPTDIEAPAATHWLC
jgi:hypothetical protein